MNQNIWDMWLPHWLKFIKLVRKWFVEKLQRMLSNCLGWRGLCEKEGVLREKEGE